jgi:FkbM family methyltransferase
MSELLFPRGALRRVRKLARLLPEPRYRDALRYGVAAAIEHVALLRTLDCATVLDLGANVGQFALAARVCFPTARIISFEPLRQPADVFRKVFADDARVELHQVAIGPSRERHVMHVSAKHDSSSLLPITELQSRHFPGTHEARTEVVEADVLHNIVAEESLTAPVLLKIDVQGFELPALQGCERLLSRITYVYVECSFAELYQGQARAEDVVLFLRERDFSLHGVYNMTYDDIGQALQGDFLFFNRRSNPCGS